MQLSKNFYNKRVLVDGQRSIVHSLLSTVVRGLLTIVFLLSITITFAQNFPVRVTPSLTPPYTPFLTDYTDAGNEKLTVQILLNDITISEYRCKLRLSIEGVNISITTNPNFVPLPLVLSGGVPQIVYGSDLSEYFKPSNLIFQGINQNEFERKGSQLPEGIYRISIEVLDYNRGTVVSNKGSATAWMILNDPPFINLPVNNAKIRPLNPQNLVFQWTPRHRGSPNAAFTTEYEVKLVEIWPAGRNPYDAINTSRPIFETTVDNTLVVYGPAETPLVLGREYALQVRAKDTSGKDLFKNNGYSEVIRFIYGDECPMPSSLLADDLGTVKARMRWQGNGQNSGYVLRYREKKQGAQWFEEHTDQTYASTTQLKAGATYEYQVCGECDAFRSAYTKEETFTTLKENPNAFVCGDPNAVTPPDGSPPLPALFINDFVTAGGFDMVVTQASGTNGRFSGEGLMIVPYFNGAKVRVTFKNISVNKSYQLTDGEIVTVWDVKSKSLRVEEKTLAEGGGKGLEGLATFEADTLVRLPGAIRGVSTNSEGDIVVETNNGSVIIDKEKGKSYAIADEVGNGYLIDKAGKITKTTATDAAIAGAKGQREYSTDPNLSVTFSRAGALTSITHYGFDEKREGTLEANYQQTKNGKWIGWKALPSNQTDIVKVTAEGNTDLSKVYFRVEGLSPQDVPLQAEQLTLTGSSNDTQRELLAYYPQADTSKEDLIVGKLNTISYDAVQKKLVLVKVNSTVFTPTAEEIKTKLNEIFRQGVVSWDEVHIEELSVSGISATSLDDGESGLLSNYTAEMRQVINAYTSKKALAPDTYYLFLAEAAKNPTKLGYMPRKKQAGFIFTKPHNNEELIQTIAHELGHGAFRLEHTFGEYPALSQGTTDNLMDYNRGTRLNKYQWDYMHNPVAVLGLFEDDEEGALVAKNGKCCDCPSSHSDLLEFEISSAINSEIEKRNKEDGGAILIPWDDWKILDMKDGFGKVNADSYELEITSLPLHPITKKQFSKEEFFAYVRVNFPDFISGNTSLEPYSLEDGIRWVSSNPLGTAMKFDTYLILDNNQLGGLGNFADDLTVMCTEITDLNWTFSTIECPDDFQHAVSGHRKFGIKTSDTGVLTFFTKGADRLTGLLDVMANLGSVDAVFNGGDTCWKNLMTNLQMFVLKNNGITKPFDINKNDYGTRYKWSKDCK